MKLKIDHGIVTAEERGIAAQYFNLRSNTLQFSARMLLKAARLWHCVVFGASVQRSSRRVGPIAEYSPRPRCPEDWPIAQFSREAEELLQQLGDQVYDTFQGRTDVDVEFSQGVLTLRFPNGTFVLNTQTPNRQIWLSSPLSGPARYYYDLDTGKWRNSRDDHMLVDRLQKDLAVFTGCNIQLNL